MLALAWPARAQMEGQEPVADPAATVVDGDVRFTVLTPQLVRMEWDDEGDFTDEPSLVFINRRLPVPDYVVRTEGGDLVVETAALRLRYRQDTGRFTEDNLEVRFRLNGDWQTWRPGMDNPGNLKGTLRTLDGVQGAEELEPGLLSRDGWVVVDDSRRPLFDDSDWAWVQAREDTVQQDLYFFGHGHDYKQALKDFTEVAGRIPMPPRFAFGLWWSRYWAYTDAEFMDLVEQFETEDVPLDVLVVDMDWHETFELRWGAGRRDQAGQWLGWTGYTWNDAYFPDPEAFLDWTEEHGLKVPLNLHPASGIQPHEQQYEAMARAVGIDPATEKYVPFDITDKHFANAYFEHVIHPLEDQGVDFWWLDWQQWNTTKIPGVTPTWWLNYVFFTDMERQGEDRPLIFHRWGGLGNHRYQIGFSGDAHSDWESLAFQPYFTSTAANVGFGYWSHDIGGHIMGEISGELYTRWLQFGVFSPAVRTHTTKNPDAERRIWAYPEEYAQAMREAVYLRYGLMPYTYTAARQAYDTGVSLVRPLYYEHPEADEAYRFPDQYYFGDDLMVAPVVSPVMEDSMLAKKAIWLPEGEWIEWYTGEHLEGGRVVERTFAIDEVPVYVRPGTLVPMQHPPQAPGEDAPEGLVLTAFAGGDHETHVYADAGNSLAYQESEFARTPLRLAQVDDHTVRVEVLPVEGGYPGLPAERPVTVRLPGTWPASSVTHDGHAVAFERRKGAPGWRYDGETLTTVVTLPAQPVDEATSVTVTFAEPVGALAIEGLRGEQARLHRAMQTFNRLWKADWTPDAMVALVQIGRRIELDPDRALELVDEYRAELPDVLRSLHDLKGDEQTIRRGTNHLHALYEKTGVPLGTE